MTNKAELLALLGKHVQDLEREVASGDVECLLTIAIYTDESKRDPRISTKGLAASTTLLGVLARASFDVMMKTQADEAARTLAKLLGDAKAPSLPTI